MTERSSYKNDECANCGAQLTEYNRVLTDSVDGMINVCAECAPEFLEEN